MKLVKGFPQPSFHMGVLTLLSQVPDLIVVEFGTEGTMRYFLNTLQMMGCPARARMFTTMMDESTVVLGSYERLRLTVKELDEEYHPPLIVAVDSTVASIIGVDVDGACLQFQDEVNATLLPLQDSHLTKTYGEGVAFAQVRLLEVQQTDPRVIEEAAGRVRQLLPFFMTGQYQAQI